MVLQVVGASVRPLARKADGAASRRMLGCPRRRGGGVGAVGGGGGEGARAVLGTVLPVLLGGERGRAACNHLDWRAEEERGALACILYLLHRRRRDHLLMGGELDMVRADDGGGAACGRHGGRCQALRVRAIECGERRGVRDGHHHTTAHQAAVGGQQPVDAAQVTRRHLRQPAERVRERGRGGAGGDGRGERVGGVEGEARGARGRGGRHVRRPDSHARAAVGGRDVGRHHRVVLGVVRAVLGVVRAVMGGGLVTARGRRLLRRWRERPEGGRRGRARGAALRRPCRVVVGADVRRVRGGLLLGVSRQLLLGVSAAGARQVAARRTHRGDGGGDRLVDARRQQLRRAHGH